MKRILENKVIIISGGTKGIGKAVAIKAAEEGAKVVIGGRSEIDGKEIVEEINNEYNSEGLFVKCDISKVEECERLISKTVEQFGKVDGLFNYAGITPVGTLIDTEEKLFDDTFNVNVKSAFFCSKFALKSMMVNGGGSIINAGSTHAYGGEYDRAAYSCSKGTLITLTKHISKNYSKHKVRCNYLTIGWVLTPNEIELMKKQGKDQKWIEEMEKKVMPMGRVQCIEDYIPLVILLLSDSSSQLTGSELHVTGGFFGGINNLT